MQRKLIFTSIASTLALMGGWTTSWVPGLLLKQTAQAQETQEVTIRFQAQVGDRAFSCTEKYSNLGSINTEISATDFRFYISGVNLIDQEGRAVPLTLQQDGRWQYQNVALLDFEDKSGGCTNGTVETRDRIVGTIPKGNYKGIQFTLGIPFNLNHEDVTLAPSPLNLSSLWWNWRGGYKFVRIDLKNQGSAPTARPNHGNHNSTPNANPISANFPIHLGSTGCVADINTQKPSNCDSSNTVNLSFNNFDPQQNVIVADLATLVAGTNLAVNQPETPLGCMSAPNDSDCTSIMANFGLPFAGKPSPEQKFFRIQRGNP